MKTEYINKESIDNVLDDIITELRHLPKRMPFDLSASKTALLVLDMQKYFLQPTSHAYIPSSGAIIPRINDLIRVFREINRPIIFTRHLNDEQNAGLMSVWWKDLIRSDNSLSEIDDDLAHEGMTLINKSQYDAFYETDLEKILHEQGIEQLVVCGVMTHLCCETTIRSAFVRGFQCFFPIDGTAAYNLDQHRSTFINLSHGFTIPTNSKTIIRELRK